MLTKRLADCQELIANDGCRVRELLHPNNDSVDLPYSLAVGVLAPRERSVHHRLAQAEVYYILEGSGIMHVGHESRPVMPGDVICVPAGAEQWAENLGVNRLMFMIIVSPPWRSEDDLRVESERGRRGL